MKSYRNFYKITRQEFNSILDRIEERKMHYTLMHFGNRFGNTDKYIFNINHKNVYGIYTHYNVLKNPDGSKLTANSEFFINPEFYNLFEGD